jgi:hypothetical protein
MGSETSVVKCPDHMEMLRHNLSETMKSRDLKKFEKNETRMKIIQMLNDKKHNAIKKTFKKLQLEDRIYKQPLLKQILRNFLINTFNSIMENTGDRCNILIKGGSSIAISLVYNGNSPTKQFVEILDSYFWGDLDISIYINKTINEDDKKKTIELVDKILKYEIICFQSVFQIGSNTTKLLKPLLPNLLNYNKNRTYTHKGKYTETNISFDTFLNFKKSIFTKGEFMNMYQLSLVNKEDDDKIKMIPLIDITIHTEETPILDDIRTLYDKSKKINLDYVNYYIHSQIDWTHNKPPQIYTPSYTHRDKYQPYVDKKKSPFYQPHGCKNVSPFYQPNDCKNVSPFS